MEFLTRHRIAVSAPLESWPAEVWSSFWSGEPAGGFPGLARLARAGLSSSLAVNRFERPSTCIGKRCSARLAEDLACDRKSRAVRIEGRSIADLTSLAIGDLLSFFQSLRFEPALEAVGSPLVAEIVGRLQYLVEVGLDYLSLGRGSDTLSGGELQRARLAAQLGSGLVGVCTILDEPTAGLHPRDTDRLIASIRRLLGQGNSVLVVEHDASMIRAADWVVDLGPGAGPDGGTVVAAGTPDQLQASQTSITARYLAQGFQLAAEPSQRLAASPGWIQIRGASLHNLKHVDAQIPLAALTCVTGVSGSGKSTLVNDVLARAVRRFLHRTGASRGDQPEGILGLEAIDQLVEVDQSPIGRGPRSTPATATGVVRRGAPGVRPDPRGQDPRLRRQPVQLQRQGGPLRSLPGPRPAQAADALPSRSARDLRGLRRQAVQPSDARSEIQGKVDRRRPGDASRREPRALRGGAASLARA